MLKNILLQFKVPLLQPCMSLFKWTKTRTLPCIQLIAKGLHHCAFSSQLLPVKNSKWVTLMSFATSATCGIVLLSFFELRTQEFTFRYLLRLEDLSISHYEFISKLFIKLLISQGEREYQNLEGENCLGWMKVSVGYIFQRSNSIIKRLLKQSSMSDFSVKAILLQQ